MCFTPIRVDKLALISRILFLNSVVVVPVETPVYVLYTEAIEKLRCCTRMSIKYTMCICFF